tara:strand:+ start:792 stop:1484 length:693 start_codon:yes stop_codon:yes gene_type:complete
MKNNLLKISYSICKHNMSYLNFGNISAYDQKNNCIYIKGSGFDLDTLKHNQICKVNIIKNNLKTKIKPSVDLNIHKEIFLKFPKIKYIVHTHSIYLTIFSQLNLPIPCLGTTHADYFDKEIPVMRIIKKNELNEYEKNSGVIITNYLKKKNIDPISLPGVLLPFHGPFIWGESVNDIINKSIVMEKIAEMAYKMILFKNDLNKKRIAKIPKYLINYHYKRKNGPNKYYGQ